jgi:hypothetical protein
MPGGYCPLIVSQLSPVGSQLLDVCDLVWDGPLPTLKDGM